MENDPTRPPFLKWLLVYLLPPLVLMALAFLLFGVVVSKFKPEPPTVDAPRVLPTVNVIEAEPKPVAITVQSQGTVQARTQTNLIAEVSGRVLRVSPSLYAGSFFRKGDLLVEIDPTDYQAALAAARSRLADARLAYQQERAAAAQAEEDWQAISDGESPSPLVLRQPQLERAEANLEAAQTAVATAERDLERAAVTAPYDGRVREKFVDVGQYLSARQSQIASIYAVDAAEIRLPISLDDTRYFELPEAYGQTEDDARKPKVTITANYGGKAYQWYGYIDRSEGAVDPQTRLLNVVARIDAPYRPRDGKPPLKVGTFVTAKIHGSELETAFELPRKALREDDTLYLVSPENRLEIRSVEVYQTTPDSVIVTDGLRPGERVSVTPLQYVVDGMEVAVESGSAPFASPDEAIVAPE